MIQTLKQLEACLGVTPPAVNLKVIDFLDDSALRWLAVSPLAFVAVTCPQGADVTIAGGELGFARAASPTVLQLPHLCLDDPGLFVVGSGVGTLFLVPGLGETLRINGRVAEVTDAHVAIAIDEVYVHCAKALIRSEFWAATPRSQAPDAAHFAAQARFVALATADAVGQADLSPKGDAAGSMLQDASGSLSYPERPGNRRKDSLKNLLTQPQAALVALIPGSNVVGVARGAAQLVDNAAVCAQFTVEGKAPKMVTTLAGAQLSLRESAALARARLWPTQVVDHGLDPATILTTHVKLSKQKGFVAGMMRTIVNKKLVGMGLQHDYKTKLY